MRLSFLLPLTVAVGCSSSSSPSSRPPAVSVSADKESDSHAHDRDKMRLADAGPYHAGLTAHLSKHGHELDILLETTDADPKPAAVVQTAIVARATRAGDATEYSLTFDPTPADERPKDEPAGQCSHFVAKAAWMQPDDVLTIKCQIEVQGMRRPVVWKEFVPRKYAHADDSATESPVP